MPSYSYTSPVTAGLLMRMDCWLLKAQFHFCLMQSKKKWTCSVEPIHEELGKGQIRAYLTSLTSLLRKVESLLKTSTNTEGEENHSHSAAWILISYLAQGDTRGERFSGAGMLGDFKALSRTSKLKKKVPVGRESHDIEELQLPGILDRCTECCSWGLMKQLQPSCWLPLFLSQESIDYPL